MHRAAEERNTDLAVWICFPLHLLSRCPPEFLLGVLRQPLPLQLWVF
jgi:hypothetical protein